MTIFELLQSTGIPAAYGVMRQEQTPPFLVYLGDGQRQFMADDTIYEKQDTYQVEYYFTEKNPVIEEALEASFLADGWIYEKSEDTYIDGQDVFVIYYTVWRKKPWQIATS